MRYFLRKKLIDFTGYFFYKKAHLPFGTDLNIDLDRLNIIPWVIFDVGANKGQTAIFFNNAYKDKNVRILSFEPINTTFAILEKNIEKFINISGYNIALGDKNESFEIVLSELSNINSLNNLLPDNENQLKQFVNVERGGAFCINNNVDVIDVLKIDTEGYEIKVLEGFDLMLNEKRIKSIYAEVCFDKSNKGQTYVGELIDYLDKFDYTFVGLYEVSNLVKYKFAQTFGNALFVPKSHLVN